MAPAKVRFTLIIDVERGTDEEKFVSSHARPSPKKVELVSFFV
mgnify:CR=1 FL=1